MKDKKWLVPAVVDPAEKVCVQLEIPNDVNHIAAFWGALEQLGKAYNWEDSYADGSLTAYVWQDVLEAAAEDVRIGEGCMIDCGDVEDCLEGSAIIDVLEGDIITNETNITTNETDITNNETNITENTTNITNIEDNPQDGYLYPPAPERGVDPDATCGAAYYVVAKSREFIVQMEAYPASEPTIFDALEDVFTGFLALSINFVQDLLAILYTVPTPPSVLTDFDAQADDMREKLYCDGFVKSEFVAFVQGLTGGAEIAEFIDCIGLSQWQQWYSAGMTDLTQDCTSFTCDAWCYEWIGADLVNWVRDAGSGFGIFSVDHWTIEERVPSNNAMRIWITQPASGVIWTQFEIDYDVLASRASAGDRIDLKVDGVIEATLDVSHTVRKTGTLTASGGGTANTEFDIEMTVATPITGGSGGAIGTITRIRISGTGAPPYGDNC